MRHEVAHELILERSIRRGECLIWTGATNKHGYGKVRIDDHTELVHRVMWESANGPIPDGLIIDHEKHCDHACIELTHLRATTQANNVANRRGAAKSNESTKRRNVYPNGSGFMVRVKGRYFGQYRSITEATKEAERARSEMFGDYGGRG